MLKIKLSPFGKKHYRHYRIVVVESRSKITGTNVAVLGHYHPLDNSLLFDHAAAEVWIKKGAQPTDRVRKLLAQNPNS